MRKGLFAVCVVSLFALGAVGLGVAGSAHFIKASVNIDSSTGNLNFSFKEAGLGNSPVDYTASADAVAVYGCINGGGHHPKASNKQTVSGPVSASGSFSPGTNGQSTGSLVIDVTEQLAPPVGFACPGGQTLVLASVTYTDAALVDTSNSIDAPLTGTCTGTSGCSAVFFKF
jgi:hypothetical protein